MLLIGAIGIVARVIGQVFAASMGGRWRLSSLPLESLVLDIHYLVVFEEFGPLEDGRHVR